MLKALYRRLTGGLVDAALARAMKTPYEHLGSYMHRYWLLPRWMLVRKVKTEMVLGDSLLPDPAVRPPLIARDVVYYDRRWDWLPGLRVHHILRSDRDHDMHTHPWWFVSLILRGEYWEVTPYKGGQFRGLPGAFANVNEPFQAAKRKSGSIAFRPRSSRHKVILMDGPVWTLVLTGRDHGEWGYMVDGDMYVDRREYEHRTGGAA